MAGRIRAEDILAVKERTSIEEVVREHVTLTRRGSALVGLCPFHDEKTGSFNVNPHNGFYHCYGCGVGGDVIKFVSDIEHLTFTEAVERLAGKVGVELRYEDGGGRREEAGGAGRRARLIEAHRVAQEFYAAYLLAAGDARAGRDFMRERGFDGAVAKRFGVGFAPRGGEELVRHLRSKGFTDDELVTGGLAGRGSRGLYDRFRGRLVWPIHDITGDTVGFGARRIFPDDRIEAKYLNTSETPIYKKSTVLYGLDAAKKAISSQRVAVVVEGYTDVMACHLAGVETAVASCGTAFGIDHIKVLRRIMRDEADLEPARVSFTFDGDAAGQAAAMKAFKEDQRWMSQSFVAVAPGGKDPCELRQSDGDPAVRELVEDAVPMFEFAVRTTVTRFDLDTAEGRVQAASAIAPILLGIRDAKLGMQYKGKAAGLIGFAPEELDPYLKEAKGRAGSAAAGRAAGERNSGDRGSGASGSGASGSGGGGSADPRHEGGDRHEVGEGSLKPGDASLPHPCRFRICVTRSSRRSASCCSVSCNSRMWSTRSRCLCWRSGTSRLRPIRWSSQRSRVSGCPRPRCPRPRGTVPSPRPLRWRSTRCSPSWQWLHFRSCSTRPPVARRLATSTRWSRGSARWPSRAKSPTPWANCADRTPRPTRTPTGAEPRRSACKICNERSLPCATATTSEKDGAYATARMATDRPGPHAASRGAGGARRVSRTRPSPGECALRSDLAARHNPSLCGRVRRRDGALAAALARGRRGVVGARIGDSHSHFR